MTSPREGRCETQKSPTILVVHGRRIDGLDCAFISNSIRYFLITQHYRINQAARLRERPGSNTIRLSGRCVGLTVALGVTAPRGVLIGSTSILTEWSRT